MTKQMWHSVFWLGCGLFLLMVLYFLHPILLPFLAGAFIAYLLDPIADWFEEKGFARSVAAIIIVIIFSLITLVLMVLLLPIVIAQMKSFIAELPGYMDKLQEITTHYLEKYFDIPKGEAQNTVVNAIQDYLKISSSQVLSILSGVFSSGMALFNTLALLFITPVVAFYLLLDWDRMIVSIERWLPRNDAPAIRAIVRDIDKTIAGFLRGQFAVCLILAGFYSTCLVLLGLKNGMFIGITAGVLSFIPYVGSAIGFLASVIMAVTQFWPQWIWIAAVVGVFLIGQFIEGNILQPKIVGQSVSLHPVWLMFALFFFGYFMGFFGMLIAVPLAAALGVIVRHLLGEYMESDFYRETEAEAGTPPAVPPAPQISSAQQMPKGEGHHG